MKKYDPKILDTVWAALEAGRSLGSITSGRNGGPLIMRAYGLKRLMAANPEWSARAAPLIESNRITAQVRKGDARRQRTNCSKGHPLTDAYIVTDSDGYVHRQCRQCSLNKIKDENAKPITPEMAEKVKALIVRGTPISHFTQGGRPGYLCAFRTIKRFKNESPEFKNLIEEYRPLVLKGQYARMAATRRRGTILKQRNDYDRLRQMIGERFPGVDEVIGNIFLIFGGKKLKWEMIPDHIKLLKAEYWRENPAAQFRKFGNARLISLDQLAYEDGTTTVGDQVSEGLWS